MVASGPTATVLNQPDSPLRLTPADLRGSSLRWRGCGGGADAALAPWRWPCVLSVTSGGGQSGTRREMFFVKRLEVNG